VSDTFQTALALAYSWFTFSQSLSRKSSMRRSSIVADPGLNVLIAAADSAPNGFNPAAPDAEMDDLAARLRFINEYRTITSIHLPNGKIPEGVSLTVEP